MICSQQIRVLDIGISRKQGTIWNLNIIQKQLQMCKIQIFSIIFKKSMKFFTITVALGLALMRQVDSAVTADCGQGKVATAKSGICIQPNYIQGCESYANQNQCATCNSSYELNNKRCDFVGGVANLLAIPGCLTTDSNGKCGNCANGFRKINGVCKQGVKHCETYNDKDKCTNCKTDYSLVLGQCRHNFLLGCRNQQPDHTCNDCFPPFKLKGNSCGIPNCTQYNDFGCVSCACGYFLTSQRNCKQMVEGCIRYQRGICINCAAHYKLKGGFCQIDGCVQYDGSSCTKCAENYEQVEGGCAFKNCYEWLDNKCLVCSRGFRKENDGCVKVTEQSLKCM